MPETVTKLGIPITGEITKGRRGHVEQRDPAELGDLIRRTTEYPNIAIRWHQYTPYFNDGDVCEFGIGEVYVNVDPDDEDNEDGDYGDGFVYVTDEAIKGGQRYRYDSRPGYVWKQGDSWEQRYVKSEDGSPFPRHEAADLITEIADALNSGAHENALYDDFGDHAIVTVRNGQAEVEWYEHE